MARNRPLTKNTLIKWYNWLVNHVPEVGKNQKAILRIITIDFHNAFFA